MQRRTFIRSGLATAAFLGCGSAAYAGSNDRHDLEVTKTSIHLGLARPVRAAVMADFHFDPGYETGYLETVFRTTAAQAPDLVFYAGDYITRSTARFAEFGEIAGRLRPPLGSYAIYGNHDQWNDMPTIRRVLEQNGIQVLRNTSVPLPSNPGWAIAGLESFWAGRPSLEAFTAPAGTQFIVLAHEPDAWDFLTDRHLRLQISGHTHGGQIRAPLIGALQLPFWGKRYDAGLFNRGEKFLYVNRGIGTVRIPYRANCRPEITILELT